MSKKTPVKKTSKSSKHAEDAASTEEQDNTSAVDEQPPAEATADELNLEQVLEKLQQAEEAADQAKDDLLRVQAEMQNLRRRTEQDKRRVVADLERQRRDHEDTLRRQQEFISEGKRSLAGQLVGTLEISSLRDHAGSTIRLMGRAHRILLELAGVHKRLGPARGALIEATRQRRAVELLRERRFDEWKKRVNRLEDNALDELAVQSAGRPNASLRVRDE